MLTENQRAELNSGIGASEVAAVLGIDPYTTPYELWIIKTGRMVKDVSNKDAVIMGNMLEPVIAKRYSQITGEKVARVNKAFRHKKFPYMLCHLDRKVIGKRKGVEIKTANPFSTAWGDAGTDEVPPNYIAQVQFQLAVSEYEESDLIVFRGTTDLRNYNFKPDADVIKVMLEKVEYFWTHHILKDIPPQVTNRGDLKLMYPANNGNFIEANDSTLDLLSMFETAKKNIKDSEAIKDVIEKNIIQFIAANDGIKYGDEIIATFQANKNGTRSLRIKRRI